MPTAFPAAVFFLPTAFPAAAFFLPTAFPAAAFFLPTAFFFSPALTFIFHLLVWWRIGRREMPRECNQLRIANARPSNVQRRFPPMLRTRSCNRDFAAFPVVRTSGSEDSRDVFGLGGNCCLPNSSSRRYESTRQVAIDPHCTRPARARASPSFLCNGGFHSTAPRRLRLRLHPSFAFRLIFIPEKKHWKNPAVAIARSGFRPEAPAHVFFISHQAPRAPFRARLPACPSRRYWIPAVPNADRSRPTSGSSR